MIFTTGLIMCMVGFAVGHFFGDERAHVFNQYDIVACLMFILGVLGMMLSIFTITWKYMP